MFMGVGSAVIMSKCEEDKEGRIEKWLSKPGI
jgi:hypothetical protein